MTGTALTPKLGQGSVILKLGTEELELKPSIHAIQQVCQRYGGIMEAVDRVSKLDFNTTLEVIFLGLGPRFSGAKQRNVLTEKIFAEGLTDDTGGIGLAVIKYLQSLARGGRPAPTEPEDEEGGEDKGN